MVVCTRACPIKHTRKTSPEPFGLMPRLPSINLQVLGPSPEECTQCCQIHLPEVRRSLQPYMLAVYPAVNSPATVHAPELLLVAKLAGSLHRAAVPGGTRDSAHDTLNASLPADAL